MEANIAALLVTIIIVKLFISHQYKKIENQVLDELGFSSWDEIPTCKIDENIIVKSRQAVNYSATSYRVVHFSYRRWGLSNRKRI